MLLFEWMLYSITPLWPKLKCVRDFLFVRLKSGSSYIQRYTKGIQGIAISRIKADNWHLNHFFLLSLLIIRFWPHSVSLKRERELQKKSSNQKSVKPFVQNKKAWIHLTCRNTVAELCAKLAIYKNRMWRNTYYISRNQNYEKHLEIRYKYFKKLLIIRSSLTEKYYYIYRM